MTDTPSIRFQPGTIVATLGAAQAATRQQIAAILARHLSGDWGDLGDEDKRSNEAALKHGDRLLSAYDIAGARLWIITEGSRELTTVLTPDEY
jgi:hypothetical protein